jgi:hypothetical protein
MTLPLPLKLAVALWLALLAASIYLWTPWPILLALAALLLWRSVLVRRMRRLERRWRAEGGRVARARFRIP